ncbi:MAG: hypothetical protein L3K16_05440 [Thermoplasmata archaeon]|nr:hypothetical protein [Thermoplasmata archaeon]
MRGSTDHGRTRGGLAVAALVLVVVLVTSAPSLRAGGAGNSGIPHAPPHLPGIVPPHASAATTAPESSSIVSTALSLTNGSLASGTPPWSAGGLTSATYDPLNGLDYLAAGELFVRNPVSGVVSRLWDQPYLNSVVFDAARGSLYATSYSAAALLGLSPTTGAILANVSLPHLPVYQPADLALDPVNGNLYVLWSNDSGAGLLVVDPASERILATIPLESGPYLGPTTVAFDPIQDEVLVGFDVPSQLTVVDPSTGRIAANVSLAGPVEQIALDNASGSIYVAESTPGAEVQEVGPTNLTVFGSTILDSGNVIPYAITYVPASASLYVAGVVGPGFNDGLGTLVGANNLTEYASGGLGVDPDYAFLEPASGRLLVGYLQLLNLTVVSASTAAPLSSAVLGVWPDAEAIDPSSGLDYVALAGVDEVDVVNVTTQTVVSHFPTGVVPDGVAFAPSSGDVYVANEYSANVTVYSPQSGLSVASLPVPQGSSGGIVDPANGDLYALDSIGGVSVYNTGDDSYVGQIPTGSDSFPVGLTLNANGSLLYVVNEDGGAGEGNVTVISTVTNEPVHAFPTGSIPTALTFDAATGQLFVVNYNYAHPNVTVLDGATGAVDATFALPGVSYPSGACIAPDGSLWVTEGTSDVVLVLNASTGADLGTRPVGLFPIAPVTDPVTGTVEVADQYSSAVSTLGPPTVGRPTGTIVFQETGLPTGTRWSVGLNGSPFQNTTSTNLTLGIAGPGAYPYDLGDVPGFAALPERGNVTVVNVTDTVVIAFAPFGYRVAFDITGAPANTTVSLSLVPGGPTWYAEGRSGATFDDVPNGSFGWIAIAPAGYQANPTAGAGDVAGAPVAIDINLNLVASSSPSSTGISPSDFYAVAGIAGAAIVAAVVIAVLFRPVRPGRPPSPPTSPP